MKITRITQQVKRPDRYSIFIDGKYSFGLSDRALLSAKIAPGQEIDENRLGELKAQSADDKLYGRTLRFTALRPRSRWEVETYLTRQHSPAPRTETILNKLSDIGLLDDAVFARAWVANRRLLRPTSRRRLLYELRQKHIASDIIEQVLTEDKTANSQVLTELITRKRKQLKYRDNLKLMQYLSNQGFRYEDIKAAIRIPLDEEFET